MLISLVVALQLQAAAPVWKVIERSVIAPRAGATDTEILLEEQASRSLVPRSLGDSARVLVLPLRGAGGTAVFAVFGAGYASDPDELTLIGFDATGYPRLLFRKDFLLKGVTDLDGDGTPEIVGLPTLSEMVGKCSTSYDPYAVYRLAAGTLRYDLALSRRYNEAHYVWAGPNASERIAVNQCRPGKYRAVPYKP